jgi:transposase
MARGFIKRQINQSYLLPPSINDWLPKDHIVRFIWDCVNVMDMTPFYAVYSHEGKPPYDPKMILAVLIYAYIKGIHSSRKIAKACEEEISFRWLTDNTLLSHSCICRFRVKHKENFKKVLVETVRLSAKSKLFRLTNVFLDGAKIKASGALESNRVIKKINEEIDAYLTQAEAEDKNEDKLYGKNKRGDTLPSELGDPRKRLKRLLDAKKQLEQEKKTSSNNTSSQTRSDNNSKSNCNAIASPSSGKQPKSSEKQISSDDKQSSTKNEEPASGNKHKANITDLDSRLCAQERGGFRDTIAKL